MGSKSIYERKQIQKAGTINTRHLYSLAGRGWIEL